MAKVTTAKSWHKRKAYPYGRQKDSGVLMLSLMNVHNKNHVDYTAHSFYTGCSCMLQALGGKNMIKPSARAGDSPCLMTLEGRVNCHATCRCQVDQRRDIKGLQ